MISVTPVVGGLLWLGLELYAERDHIESPVTTIVSYICISPFMVAGAIITMIFARCAWVGLALLIRRTVAAVREATSASLDSKVVVDRQEPLPVAGEFDSLQDSVYGRENEHSRVTVADA